jgi:hypothetical protein
MFLCSIDATVPSTALGRLVNDGIEEKQNCHMKLVPFDNTPHLCLFATKDIAPHTELRYNYGIEDLPWREQGQSKKTGKNLGSSILI